MLVGDSGAGKSLIQSLLFPNAVSSEIPKDANGVGRFQVNANETIIKWDDIGREAFENVGDWTTICSMTGQYWACKTHGIKSLQQTFCLIGSTNYEGFKDELGKRKSDIVESNPDYIIEIQTISMDETVTIETEDEVDYLLSKINTAGTYTLTNAMEDVPGTVIVKNEVKETLQQDKKKNKSKGGDYEIREFGGAKGAMEAHGKEARREFRSIFIKRQ